MYLIIEELISRLYALSANKDLVAPVLFGPFGTEDEAVKRLLELGYEKSTECAGDGYERYVKCGEFDAAKLGCPNHPVKVFRLATHYAYIFCPSNS